MAPIVNFDIIGRVFNTIKVNYQQAGCRYNIVIDKD